MNSRIIYPYNQLKMSEDDLTDFIAVASNALKNDERLFEAKYHMFIRGIEGVFVTLAPLEKLFINKMDSYKENKFDDKDIGYKVYEVSFCNNCNALFITGHDDNGKLVQTGKYNDDYSPVVYLLSGEFDENDEDNENENTYQICAKCGEIKKASSINGLQCDHGKKYINKIVKVKEKGKELHECPCCHSRNSQNTILRPYHLGTEAATGDYITFADSDDYIQPDTYRPLIQLLNSNTDYDFVEYPVAVHFGGKHQSMLTFKDQVFHNINDYWTKLHTHTHCYVWNKIFKRQLFDGIQFSQKPVGGNATFNINVLSVGDKVLRAIYNGDRK